MKHIKPEESGVDVGVELDFEGTVWRSSKTGRIYILPLIKGVDYQQPVVIDLDSVSELDLLNKAFLLENQRFLGSKKQATKTALGISRKHIEQRIAWEVFRRDGFKCVYCGSNDGPMTFDHYIPESVGGLTSVENGKTACRWCNHHKADMDPVDWENSELLIKRRKSIKKAKYATNKAL